MATGSSQHKLLAVIIILASFTVGTLSVTGLLQSTERVSSSGIVVVPAPPMILPGGSPSSPPSPPPPEPEVEIDVFSDQACTQPLSSVTWGEIEAGDSAQKTIYVKNNGEVGVYLSLDTEDWTPSNASNYMSLSWDYSGSSIPDGQVRAIVLTLNVSSDCPAMSDFNFNIIIIGS